MATDINTLAKRCGVSKATISRVFTGRARVSDAIRARVLAAARELDYRPQQVVARDCVAIVVGERKTPDFRLRFTERLLTPAIFEITRKNLLTEVITPDELAKLYDAYTRAVLLLLSEPEIEACRAELEKLPMPILTVNKEYPFSSSINTDHGQGVLLALDHLRKHGHSRIAMTLDRLDNQAGVERRSAYETFMKDAMLSPLPIVHYGEENTADSSQNLDALLAEKPTAVIFCGESVALPAVHDLQRRGIRIPEDLSVITSELAGVSCWQNPPMTTINQNIDALATETIQQLLNRIRNPHAPQTTTKLPSTLIVRESVADAVPPGEVIDKETGNNLTLKDSCGNPMEKRRKQP